MKLTQFLKVFPIFIFLSLLILMVSSCRPAEQIPALLPAKTLPPTWTPEPTIGTPTITPSPTITPTKTPSPPDSLPNIAYLKGDQIWFWEAGSSPKALLPKEKIVDLRLSDNGKQVIYRTSSGELWVINNDGTNLHPLLTSTDLVRMSIRQEALYAIPIMFGFLPGTNRIAVTTYDYIPPGNNLLLNEDLYMIDLISGELITVLGPWQGGVYSFSPDGSLISIDTKGVISLVNPDGRGRKEVFWYAEIPTEGHRYYYYYPNLVWLLERPAFMVVIPPSNILADPPLATEIWEVPLDGSGARRVFEFRTGVPAHQSRPRLDPTGQRIAYQIALENTTSSATTIRLENLDGSGGLTCGSGEIKLFSWSPDGQYLIYSQDDQPYLVHFGQETQSLVEIFDPLIILGVESATWIDSSTFLLHLKTDQGYLLWLGSVDGRGLQVDLTEDEITDVDSALPK